VRFDKPGVVVLGCNIHDWMLAYVYVSESPFFAVTGKDGVATLRNLPPGSYQVRVWHPRQKEPEQGTAQVLTIPETGGAAAQWQVTLNPDPRIRRHPGAGGSDYH
jgi:hypothetical protein